MQLLNRPDNVGLGARNLEIAISVTLIERRLIYLPPSFILQQQRRGGEASASSQLLSGLLRGPVKRADP